jgi:hypothetical protein
LLVSPGILHANATRSCAQRRTGISQLPYRGPSIEALHRHYAEQGRIDERAPVRSEESMAGLLLVLCYNSAKLQADRKRWLAALKTAAEQR